MWLLCAAQTCNANCASVGARTQLPSSNSIMHVAHFERTDNSRNSAARRYADIVTLSQSQASKTISTHKKSIVPVHNNCSLLADKTATPTQQTFPQHAMHEMTAQRMSQATDEVHMCAHLLKHCQSAN